MIHISEKYLQLKSSLPPYVRLIAVSKTHPVESIVTVYQLGHRDFGENKVQELVEKYEQLPKDIYWHIIGHLQTNKVKYIASFIHLIHSVDSLKLLTEINKQAQKNNRIIDCLLQVYIAKEETKFGFEAEEIIKLFQNDGLNQFPFVRVRGLMGMATNTDNTEIVLNEFSSLNSLFKQITQMINPQDDFNILSMGMSNDYQLAIDQGSNMVRIGSTIFGSR
jgi:pyridoxal phosphate enzyme (YggS family)